MVVRAPTCRFARDVPLSPERAREAVRLPIIDRADRPDPAAHRPVSARGRGTWRRLPGKASKGEIDGHQRKDREHSETQQMRLS